MFKLSKLQACLFILLPSSVLFTSNAISTELNDTGLGENKYSAEQSDYYFYPKDVTDYPGQDPQYGRDALEQADNLNKVGSGHSGFDFSDTDDCVVDNVTGLTWEVKTDAADEDLQSNKWNFTWRDDSVGPLVKEIVPVAEKAAPEPETIHEEITLSSKILFDYDKSILTEEAKASIDEYIESIRDKFDKIRNITIVGHTDGIASQEYNQKLSEARAQSVADYLEAIDGIPDTEIQAIGKGKLEPVDTNETDEGRANNRRVVLDLELENSNSDLEIVNSDMTDTETEYLTKDQPLATTAFKLPESAVPAICSDSKESISCDTQSYIAKMNEIALCGYNDWRLPTREELRSIADYGFSMPAIDKDFFPNTLSSAYWTSSLYVNNEYRVWVVDFEHGGDNTHEKHRALPIRLVRYGEKDATAKTIQETDLQDKEDNTFSDLFSPVTDLWK